MHSKSELRHIFLQKRKAIASKDRALWSERILHNLIQLVQAANTQPSVIAGYMPVSGEVDIAPALHVLAASYKIVLPVVTQESRLLKFRRWQPDAPLVRGPFGIKEPTADAAEETPDLVIVPLVAYGPNGQRLGYGGGHYDATLRHLRPIRTIGAAFSLQYSTEIPIEPQDEMLDIVVTENG